MLFNASYNASAISDVFSCNFMENHAKSRTNEENHTEAGGCKKEDERQKSKDKGKRRGIG